MTARWLKAGFGALTAPVVHVAARLSTGSVRSLSRGERSLAMRVFGAALALDRVRLHERLSGPANVSGRAFVIEDTVHLPPAASPPRDALLIHELTHVWQWQHGGHAYMGDSVAAQLWGEGYDLPRALRRGARWAELNAEQQATLVEWAFAQGCFDGAAPFLVAGEPRQRDFDAARAALHAGQGAAF